MHRFFICDDADVELEDDEGAVVPPGAESRPMLKKNLIIQYVCLRLCCSIIQAIAPERREYGTHIVPYSTL